jgi:diacylglycerol O-acyltransferase / wax synthase
VLAPDPSAGTGDDAHASFAQTNHWQTPRSSSSILTGNDGGDLAIWVGTRVQSTPAGPRNGARPSVLFEDPGCPGAVGRKSLTMAEDVEFERRMSDSDALMWTIEKDPLLRSTITTVMVFSRPMERQRLRQRLDRVSRAIPRLRQRVRSHTLSIAPPWWDVDPNFDLDYHLRFVRGLETGTLREVFELAEPIAMQGFDRARPLWEFVLVEGLADDRVALITKIHHSITDGIGGIRLLMELLDLDASGDDDQALPEAPEPEPRSEPVRMADALAYESRRQLDALGRATSSVRRQVGRLGADPVGVGTDLLGTAGSVLRMVRPATAPLSPLMTERSLSVRFDALQVPLAPMKASARLVGGKLNDSFVAAVIGGLSRYHRELGRDCHQLRMTMPINIRTDATQLRAGNQFTPVRFAVPADIVDPIARMSAVRELMAAQRQEPGLALSETLAGIINRLPATASTGIFGSMLKGIDFVTSNVPGPPVPVYLLGARLERQIALGPMTGSATNLTLLSYIDDLDIGINTDPRAITEPERFVDCLRDSFDEIVKLV